MDWQGVIIWINQHLAHPGEIWLELIYALAIFLLFIILQGTVVRLLYLLVRKLVRSGPVPVLNHILDAFEKPVRGLVVILGAYLALVYLRFIDPAEKLFILHLFRSLVVIFIFCGLYRCFNGEKLMGGELQKKYNLTQPLTGFITKIIKFIIVALGFVLVVSEWGYDINGFIAGLGLGGLAIALAAQSALADLVGGASIMMAKPYVIGDWIKTPTIEGVVEEIGFRRTVIRTFSQDWVSVPNATLAAEAISNLSRRNKRQLEFQVGISCSTSVERVRLAVERIRQMLREHAGIDHETLIVNLEKIGDSSLDILIYSYTKTVAYDEFCAVREDVNLKIINILNELEVSLAFPSRSIYIETE